MCLLVYVCVSVLAITPKCFIMGAFFLKYTKLLKISMPRLCDFPSTIVTRQASVACLSEVLLHYLYITNGFGAIFTFAKIPFFFQNSSISLHACVVMANITAQPPLASYTKTTKIFGQYNYTLVEVNAR